MRAMLGWLVFGIPAIALTSAWLFPLVTQRGLLALGALFGSQVGLVANTVGYALATAAVGTGLGWLLAHLVHTYAVGGHRVLHALCVAPLLLPSFTFAMALIVLFGHNGLVTTRVAPGFEIYGLGGLVLAGTLARFPTAYLTLSWAYRRLNPALAEAARALGASPVLTFRTAVLPRLIPALTSSFLFLLADALADVAIPLVIGGGYPTLATRMREAIAAEGDLYAAAAYALAMAVPAALLSLVALRIGRERPTRIGPPPSPTQRPGGTGRVLVAAGWGAALLVAALLAAIVTGSLGGVGSSPLAGFDAVLAGPGTRPLAMSLLLALIVAPLAVVVAFALTAASTDDRARLQRARRLLTAVSVLPPTTLGLGAYLLLTSTSGWLHDAGWAPTATPWLAMLAILALHLVRFVPRLTLPALHAAGASLPQLTDAASMLGVGRAERNRGLLWPRVRAELTGGGLATFADALTAVSSVVLLTNAQVPLLTVSILGDVDAGRLASASAETALLGIAVAAVFGIRALAFTAPAGRTGRRAGVG